MTKLGDGTPVLRGAQPAFNCMVGLVDELQRAKGANAARRALRAFIAVRRQYLRTYDTNLEGIAASPTALVEVIRAFVTEESESGRRAQAIVAALMDVALGESRVESGRIHDPSRHYPGDVCVRSATDESVWEKAIEVRDKPVSASDVRVFARKCIDMNVRDVAVVAVANRQPALDVGALNAWADDARIGLTLFVGWDHLVDQALFWASDAKPGAANAVVGQVAKRLEAVEASPAGVARWFELLTASRSQ